MCINRVRIYKWRNGKHQGYSAGKDLTDVFKNVSPHDNSIFKGIPVVGKYVG
jgi:predicted heme/steroid binding protein